MASYLLVRSMFEEKKVSRKNAERIYRNRTAPLDLFDDSELMNRYRLSRRAIEEVIELCRADLERATQRSRALNPDLQVLITLRYLGKGGFQSELADLHGVSQPTVSRAIGITVDILSKKLDLISFPKDATSQREVKLVFHAIAGFPNVLGCIDGTLIAIIRPQASEETAYVCRKGFHAVNIQAICDGDLRFTNVVCRWPGATHDSFIFNNSPISDYLEKTAGRDGWLLGDSGYACRPWMITPLSNPQSHGEERFNRALCKTRNTVERAFGLMKSRFRCLHKSTGCLPFKPEKCHRLIYAVCQLHNMCINHRLPPMPALPEEDGNDQPYDGPLADGHQTRKRLIDSTFN